MLPGNKTLRQRVVPEDLLNNDLGEHACKKDKIRHRKNLCHSVIENEASNSWMGDLESYIVFHYSPELKQRSGNLYACINQSLAAD